jgi:hypothetical protein
MGIISTLPSGRVTRERLFPSNPGLRPGLCSFGPSGIGKQSVGEYGSRRHQPIRVPTASGGDPMIFTPFGRKNASSRPEPETDDHPPLNPSTLRRTSTSWGGDSISLPHSESTAFRPLTESPPRAPVPIDSSPLPRRPPQICSTGLAGITAEAVHQKTREEPAFCKLLSPFGRKIRKEFYRRVMGMLLPFFDPSRIWRSLGWGRRIRLAILRSPSLSRWVVVRVR